MMNNCHDYDSPASEEWTFEEDKDNESEGEIKDHYKFDEWSVRVTCSKRWIHGTEHYGTMRRFRLNQRDEEWKNRSPLRTENPE